MDKTGAVIVAAGRGERMGGRDKLLAELGGMPLLSRVIGVFQRCEAVAEIVVVVAEENLERVRELTRGEKGAKISALCPGGARRQDSVREGLKRLVDCRWVVIHDGARPLLTEDLIVRGLTEVESCGAVVAAVPVKDTIKVALPDGMVKETPSREGLWVVQTPQVFRFDLIWRAHEEVAGDVSDDAMMVEKLGHGVRLFRGSYENIKITTPEDLELAEVILRRR